VNVTDAKVKLVSDKADKLKAFCTITVDHEFVIRDIKVIKGNHGCFVAMPSRKLMDRCPSCGGKNHLRAVYCNDCGGSLRENRVARDVDGRAKLHADIAHPINSVCRERLQSHVLEAYESELERSKQPDYVPPPDEDVILDTYQGYDDSADEGRAERRVEQAPEAASPPPQSPESAPAPDGFSSGIF
jgi:stage V sporulation protein G